MSIWMNAVYPLAHVSSCFLLLLDEGIHALGPLREDETPQQEDAGRDPQGSVL